jgi:Leucine-rich repeat (LRR) protein
MSRSSHTALALEITKAACKALFPNVSTRYEGLADLAKFAFVGSDRWKQQNSFRRQMEEGVDVLTERLEILDATEIHVDSSERDIAIQVITEAITNSTLNKRELEVKKMLNRDEIVKDLEPVCREKWSSAFLSEPAVEYGRLFLRESCEYMITLVRNLPEFNDDITWETYVATKQLSHTLESSIKSVVLPRYRPGTTREIIQFEAMYSTDIVATFGTLELFGIDLPPEFRRQPLDIAYITLTASTQLSSSGDSRGDDISRAALPERFDALIAKILRVSGIWDNKQLSPQEKIQELTAALNRLRLVSSGEESGSDGPVAPPGRQRHAPISLLITGRAGSGKTTAARWLAVQIASRRLPSSLAALNDYVPFVVPLRNAFRGSRIYPTEDDLINAVASHWGAEIPGNWVNERLASGKAVVIFDGLDELSEAKQSTALAWLDKLRARYPRSHFIVTSRPEGLDAAWFEKRAFLNVALQPMELSDIQDCVAAWFTALRQASPRGEWDSQNRSENLLISDINSRRSVQDLAETPLLCAMLCAYYTHNISESAPRSRGELYGSIINVLVDARERQRGISLDSPPFDLRQKLSLLQAIARYLTDSQKIVISLKRESDRPASDTEKSALQVIEQRLVGMPTAQITATEALRFMIKRSVVFERIASNEAQFAHKTFQEYLAARDFALGGGLNELLIRVNDSTWHQILVFAASVAPTDVASRLVNGILSADTSNSADKRERLLLAAECLSAASDIAPEVAQRASAAITQILPPKTAEEATLVAGFGEGILPWLATSEGADTEIIEHCVRAAALIGGPGALEVIARYSQSPVAEHLEAVLLECWDRFDPEEYARAVLANVSFHSSVRIKSAKLINALRLLPNIRRLKVQARHGITDLREWGNLSELTELDLGGVNSLQSLTGIDAMTGLKKLGLKGTVSLENIDGLFELRNLEELYLSGCEKLVDVERLRHVRSLRVLDLNNCVELRKFNWISDLQDLRTLSLSGCYASDLEFCSRLTGLRTLKARVAIGIAGTLDVSNSTFLRHLTLKLAANHDLGLPTSGFIRTLVLAGPVTEQDLSVIGRCGSLRDLMIEDGSQLSNLSALRELGDLRRLVIRGATRLRDAAGTVGTDSQLRTLDLPESSIEDLNFLHGLQHLEYLNLDGCRALQDVSVLGGLHCLRFISLLEGVRGVDEYQISCAAENAGFKYDHDPYDPSDYGTG